MGEPICGKTVDVTIILGSESDLPILEEAKITELFNTVGVNWSISIASAHRHPDELTEFCRKQKEAGTLVFVGAAGMAAALPGCISAAIVGTVPVLGVALPSKEFSDAMDAVLAMVRMPSGRPVACCGIGKSGFYNAAITACAIVGAQRPLVTRKIGEYLAVKTAPPQFHRNVTGQQ